MSALGEHFAAGRLDQDEYDTRVQAAYASRTRVDLQGLFGDLPEPAPFRPLPAAGLAGRAGGPGPPPAAPGAGRGAGVPGAARAGRSWPARCCASRCSRLLFLWFGPAAPRLAVTVPGHHAGMDFDALVQRATGLVVGTGPGACSGSSGAPGAGKSTLAARLVAAVGPAAAWVPMDGFHLADAALDRLGLPVGQGRAGDLRRLGLPGPAAPAGRRDHHPVYAPDFERTLEQPLAGSIAVDPRSGWS